jgi:hypothetical protein
MNRILALFSAALAGSLALLPIGCETDSADTFIRDVSVNYSGFYTACEGNAAIVQQNSGSRIRTLDLRQDGDRLEAVDNNGLIWRGQLGEPQGGRSSFELRGRTSTGVEGIFSGTLSSSDGGSTNAAGSAKGTMTGTYIEPDRFSSFCGRATIPGRQGGGGGGTNTNINLVITSKWSPAPAHLTLGAYIGPFLNAWAERTANPSV